MIISLLWLLTFQDCTVTAISEDIAALPLECFEDIRSLLERNQEIVYSRLETQASQSGSDWCVDVLFSEAPELKTFSVSIFLMCSLNMDFYRQQLEEMGVPEDEVQVLFDKSTQEDFDSFKDSNWSTYKAELEKIPESLRADAGWVFRTSTVYTYWASDLLNRISPRSRQLVLQYVTETITGGACYPVIPHKRLKDKESE